jgi:hypothetical protein
MTDEPLQWFGILSSIALMLAGAWNHEWWLILTGILILIMYYTLMGD